MQGPGDALATLQRVFGDTPLVACAYQQEGGDLKLCCQVLWELLPQVWPSGTDRRCWAARPARGPPFAAAYSWNGSGG